MYFCSFLLYLFYLRHSGSRVVISAIDMLNPISSCSRKQAVLTDLPTSCFAVGRQSSPLFVSPQHGKHAQLTYWNEVAEKAPE